MRGDRGGVPSEAAPATIVTYVRDLVAADRRLFWTSVALAVAAAVTESVGLVLIIPLVVSAGVVDADSGFAGAVDSTLESLGIPRELGPLLAVFVAVIAVRAALGWARAVTAAHLRTRFVDRLRVRLMTALAEARWTFHLARRRSDDAHALASDVERVQAGTSVLLDVFARAVVLVGYVLVALRLSVATTALAMGVLVVLTGVLWPTVRRARDVGRRRTGTGRRAFREQTAFFDALKLAKSHGTVDRHVDSYRASIDDTRATVVEFERMSAATSAAIQVAVAITLAAMTWAAVEWFDTADADLLALVAVVARLGPGVGALVTRGQGIANMLPAYDAVRVTMSAAAQARESPPGGSAAGSASSGGGADDDVVELRSVSFAYEPGRPVLCDVDLRLDRGRVVALAGPSGAGKTTLGDVVLGLLTPDSGTVTVGGRPLDGLGSDRWRRTLAYVPQETFLLHDTLRANIEWGVGRALDAGELVDVLEATALDRVVTRLPDGIDTVVGDRGERLSGGERQRVALARALARRPALLVLDEATSALDRETERTVRRALEERRTQMAVLVIAHRLGTIRHADEIVVLDQGRVVERGAWDDLVSSGGALSELVRLGTDD